jgi:hypothetical protein
VVSRPIIPPFAGNLLVQASGFASGPSAVPVECRAFLGESPIGELWFTTIQTGETSAGLAVTGAASVAQGQENTVSVRCAVPNFQAVTFHLTMFALVTG